ncbi:HlyD family secretion protein [Pseudodesulfovibrio cashew]|uniref:HlyD family secretion protein n=1 Tax=Pseudodesulfovibrio cashew TaxID=2678688 RepID=UPI001F554CF2|nr:HlyD family efflux transporter periplasmic adaptor subunit [Pseudodesulfovibrio cashew]
MPFFLLIALAACSDSPENRFQGYVEGEYVYVSPAIGGTLERLMVQRGQSIARDALLFTLDRKFELAAVEEARHSLQQAQDNLANLEKGQRPSEIASIQAQLRQAKASANLAKIEFERRLKLIEEQTISQEELDRTRSDYEQKAQLVRQIGAELTTARLGARSDEIRAATAQVLQAEAKLKQAQWNLDQKQRTAPAAGFVFDTYYRPGEWVAASKPVVSLLPPENVEIRFYVPQNVVSRLKTDQEVSVTMDGRETPVPAHIYYISPSAEYTPPVIYSSESRAKLVFMLKARPAPAEASGLHPGQPVDVTAPELAP